MKTPLLIILTICLLNETFERNIHERWSVELKKYVGKDGLVDYENWNKNTEGLDAYISVLKKNHPKDYWSKNEKMSYWINAYNSLTIKIILENYPVSSIRKIKNVWGEKILFFEHRSYSLDEIEHDILRKMKEPRIHFAINCASISCPKLSKDAYLSYKLEKQLEDATVSFIVNKNEINTNEIKISKLFFWFKKDFGSNENLLNFINNYSPIEIKNPKIKYLAYNWDLNIIK
tara:strand:- start:8119 stop:8814 length:696 start_codon:yes stop_codon:yes gene_type:complete